MNYNIAVIGLGYVGLPLANALAKNFNIIGYDINQDRIMELNNGKDSTKELSSEQVKEYLNKNLIYTNNEKKLNEANFYIITVPTPINNDKTPNLTPVIKASETVSKFLSMGDIVVYESTVYPGVTEEICVPILESVSRLQINKDFFVGYSPERINPGDKEHTVTKIKKVVSGSTTEALSKISKVYSSVITAGVYEAESIKVAEAAKVIENTQRDINIAFVNELSVIFNKMGIDTKQVLKAAGTKWNFLNFFPGLVGGHCIGVDPYYLTHKAQQAGYHAKVITSGRYVNDSMGFYIAKQTVKKILAQGKHIQDAKVLVMGATFKEDVSDIRNSKIVDIVSELKSFQVKVDLVDPHADSSEMEHEYGIALATETQNDYDAVIVAVNHEAYLALDEKYFQGILKDSNGVFVDVKGIYKNKMKELDYWSL